MEKKKELTQNGFLTEPPSLSSFYPDNDSRKPWFIQEVKVADPLQTLTINLALLTYYSHITKQDHMRAWLKGQDLRRRQNS